MSKRSLKLDNRKKITSIDATTSVESSDLASVKILDRSCFSVQANQLLKEICSDQLKKLNIVTFEFARVYDDSQALILYSDPKIAHYVISNQIHVSAHMSPDQIKPRFWYLPSDSGPYQKLMRDVNEMSNVGVFADYFERFPGYYDMFCFWAKYDPTRGVGQFVNLKENLENFSRWFREQAKGLISDLSQDRFLLPEVMRPNFKGLSVNESALIPGEIRLTFEKVQQVLSQLNQYSDFNLSSREIDCVRSLIFGKTSKDIAQEFNLSYRTVESYLESIKNKLNCEKKSKIIETIINKAS